MRGWFHPRLSIWSSWSLPRWDVQLLSLQWQPRSKGRYMGLCLHADTHSGTRCSGWTQPSRRVPWRVCLYVWRHGGNHSQAKTNVPGTKTNAIILQRLKSGGSWEPGAGGRFWKLKQNVPKLMHFNFNKKNFFSNHG